MDRFLYDNAPFMKELSHMIWWEAKLVKMQLEIIESQFHNVKTVKKMS